MEKNGNLVEVRPNRIIYILSVIIILLIMASIVGQFFKFVLGHNYVYGFVPKFNRDKESNVPTFFSSFLLLISALLLWIIAEVKKKARDLYARLWFMLSLIFLSFSMDESAGIHELMINPLRSLLKTSGIFYFAWVIPVMILLLIFALSYFKFFIDLPIQIKHLFSIAFILYVAGALGFELIGGYYADLYGTERLLYVIITTIEESLEMIGILIFVHSLFKYLETYLPRITFDIFANA